MNQKSLSYPTLILLLLIVAVVAKAQQANTPPFYKDIQAFKKQDSISFPKKDGIVFVGSSTFTNWKDVKTYFPGYNIINRGFGGSTFPDVIRYAKDVIYPYKPKQVVIYCGDNDLASSDSVTASTILSRFKQLYGMIRQNLGNSVTITFVSIKPSPSRKHLMPKVEEANMLVEAYISTEKNASFIDTYHPMLAADKMPIKSIFREDSLHVNAKGYAIWQKTMKPYLLK